MLLDTVSSVTLRKEGRMTLFSSAGCRVQCPSPTIENAAGAAAGAARFGCTSIAIVLRRTRPLPPRVPGERRALASAIARGAAARLAVVGGGHREGLVPLARAVAACVSAGKDPLPILERHFNRREDVDPGDRAGTPTPLVYTLGTYIRDVFLPYNQPPRVRKAQARDYRRHLQIVSEQLGDVILAHLSRS